MTAIVERLRDLELEGLHPSVVRADRESTNQWAVVIVLRNMFPVGEGGGCVGNVPGGIRIQGAERWPDDSFTLAASQEGIEAMMSDAARYLGHDVERIDATGNRDAAMHGYPHYRTIPA